jgi:hypothetical protein
MGRGKSPPGDEPEEKPTRELGRKKKVLGVGRIIRNSLKNNRVIL